MAKISNGNDQSVNVREYIKILKILSPREIEVLEKVAKGFSSNEIGERLHISHRTVQKHRENIKKKIGLKGYRSLQKWAIPYSKYDDH